MTYLKDSKFQCFNPDCTPACSHHLVYILFVITLIACGDERERDNSNNEDGGDTFDCRRGSPCNDGFSCQLNEI